MANINFKLEARDESKGFRAGRPQSVLVNGVTFTIKGYKLGRYEGTSQDEKSQSILLTTSVNEDINVNRFLNGRKIIFDEDGKAHPFEVAEFRNLLQDHLNTLGRREDDPSYIVGTADDVAKHLLTFFKDKTIVCEAVPGFVRDKDNRLVVPFNDIIRFRFTD